jgi:hypothetical protein
MQQLAVPLRGLQCIASSHSNSNRHLRRATRQQHGMTRHSSRRLQAPSKRGTLIQRKALQKGGASSSKTSSKAVPQKRVQQQQGSSGSSQPADSTSSPYWWLQSLPGWVTQHTACRAGRYRGGNMYAFAVSIHFQLAWPCYMQA